MLSLSGPMHRISHVSCREALVPADVLCRLTAAEAGLWTYVPILLLPWCWTACGLVVWLIGIGLVLLSSRDADSSIHHLIQSQQVRHNCLHSSILLWSVHTLDSEALMQAPISEVPGDAIAMLRECQQAIFSKPVAL